MKYSNVYCDGFGYELPPNTVSSEDLERQLAPVYDRLKLPFGRLELMSGIRTRRLWDTGTKPSDGAILAGRKALQKAECEPEEIDCLIFTSVCRDMMEPATATIVHHGLGLSPSCLVFDISNACLGFLDGVVMLANMLELGQIRKGLVVSGETAEDLLQSTVQSLLADTTLSRKSIKPSFASLTIGSGAVGVVVSAEKKTDQAARLVGCSYRTDTSQNDLCQGGNEQGGGVLMATNSEVLLQKGVETAAAAWQVFIEEIGWSVDSINRFFCHQVGSAHARLLFETLQLDPRKNFETLAYLGNVGSVSAPITLAIGTEKQPPCPGERAAVLGIGSGINCLMLGLEW